MFRLFKSPDYMCPETKRACFKVATLMDSSGKYLAFKVCKGSETEPNILNSWDFYHQLKAAEAQIALPGVVVIPPPPFHPEHPRPPPGIGPRAVGRAGGRGPRAPRPEPDIPRLPAVQMLPPTAYLNRLRWRLNVTKVPPNCQTTAAGGIPGAACAHS